MNYYDGKSTFYGKLPEIYDLLFLQNRDEQISYLLNVISSVGEIKTCFDVGCGTGLYTERLAKSGLDVFGVDLSADMLEQAKRCHSHSRVRYEKADITRFHTEEQYDLAVALSHVIGYMWENDMVEAMLRNINKSLRTHGLFLFNFYHGPGVAAGKLCAKFKQASDQKYKVTRVSSVQNNEMENILEHEYYYIIEEADQISSVAIQDRIRYFSVPEIQYYLDKAGFCVEKIYNYLTYDPLTPNDWNGFIIAKKL